MQIVIHHHTLTLKDFQLKQYKMMMAYLHHVKRGQQNIKTMHTA